MSMIQLSDEQKAPAYASGSHALVLAGAGSGKTRTLLGRVLYLLESGVQPEKILLLTFTRKSAEEMKSRMRLEVSEDVIQRMSIGTFHYFCFTTLVRRPALFGFEKLRILDDADQKSMLSLIRGQYTDEEDIFPETKKILSSYSYARNTDLSFQAYLMYYSDIPVDAHAPLVFMMNDYTEKKKELGYLDFDDIIELYVTKLSASPEYLAEQKNRFQHILVDEMQDTNPMQWKILDQLRDPAELFCVGDDAQSIYAFRGADFQNVHSFTDRIMNSRVFQLVENYRSSQEILDVSNWVLEASSLRYDKRLVSVLGPSNKKPSLRDFNTSEEEASHVFRSIARDLSSGIQADDIAVLARASFTLRMLESCLATARIPYRVVGGPRLFDAAHVKEVLSILYVCANPTDELAWMKYLTLWPRIGEKAAYKALKTLLSCEQSEIPNQLREAFPKLPIISDIFVDVSQQTSPYLATQAAVRGVSSRLEELPKYKTSWKRRSRDFNAVLNASQKYRSLLSFLNDVTLDPVDTHDTSLPRVTLSTVHSAKGTEFQSVYVIQAQAGSFPSARGIVDSDLLEEERRLLYVALTRAKQKLSISRVFSTQTFVSSGFLDDIPKEFFCDEV